MKMYCLFSEESLGRMGGVRGKMTSQAGHAFLHAFWDSMSRFPKNSETYLDKNQGRATKITLVCKTDKEMLEIEKSYKSVCGTTVVIDAGLTVFKEPTLTCVGIGPLALSDIGEDLKALKLLT